MEFNSNFILGCASWSGGCRDNRSLWSACSHAVIVRKTFSTLIHNVYDVNRKNLGFFRFSAL